MHARSRASTLSSHDMFGILLNCWKQKRMKEKNKKQNNNDNNKTVECTSPVSYWIQQSIYYDFALENCVSVQFTKALSVVNIHEHCIHDNSHIKASDKATSNWVLVPVWYKHTILLYISLCGFFHHFFPSVCTSSLFAIFILWILPHIHISHTAHDFTYYFSFLMNHNFERNFGAISLAFLYFLFSDKDQPTIFNG